MLILQIGAITFALMTNIFTYSSCTEETLLVFNDQVDKLSNKLANIWLDLASLSQRQVKEGKVFRNLMMQHLVSVSSFNPQDNGHLAKPIES